MYLPFYYIIVMAENQVKSREAKLDFDEHVLEGEEENIPHNLTRNEIFEISSGMSLAYKYQILKRKVHGLKKVVELEVRC